MKVTVVIKFDNSNRKTWLRLLPKLNKFVDRMVRTKGIQDAWWELGGDDERKERQMGNLRLAHELHKRVYGRKEN